MSRDEAKQVLLLYRPGTADADDPQVEAAIALARQDPELGSWFNDHVRFQSAMRAKMREMPVPVHLKAALMAKRKLIFPAPQPWWMKPSSIWLAAAAAVVLLAGVFSLWMKPSGRSVAEINRFENFKERMVGDVQRNYLMEIETPDMSQLRKALVSRGGTGDYTVPRGVESLKLTGGGVLKWQGNPVSMVCFDRGGGKMLYLFVMKRNAVKDPPRATPELGVVHEWPTASWTSGENTYVLAGDEEPELSEFAKRYL